MKKRRWQKPKAKPGELKAQWGKLPYDDPDMCYVWGGGGASKCDGSLLHCMFNGHKLGFIDSLKGGFLAEFEKRGYDLTTLKFSIRKAGVRA